VPFGGTAYACGQPKFRFNRQRSFEILINLKAATTLGIEIPPAVMARASDVIR